MLFWRDLSSVHRITRRPKQAPRKSGACVGRPADERSLPSRDSHTV
jgi:hypothetical protein